MSTKRTEELMSGMKAFSKDKYHKEELLTEMFSLQQEIIRLTFNEDHVSTADLRIWDVEKHLQQMNENLGHVADEELQKFMDGCKILCNLIKAEISGSRGEAKAFRTLEYIHTPHLILKNVELHDGEFRTELDAVVITSGVITIVEVKNTAKDIFIDEAGNYYRTGEFLKWDCNLADKMNLKEDLIRKALAAGAIKDVKIHSIVVFTNNRIEVQNKFENIKTCFSSQLAYIIDGFKDDAVMSRTDMDAIQKAISESTYKEAYEFEFDVNQYKLDFVRLMVKLEEASAVKDHEEELVQEAVQEKQAEPMTHNNNKGFMGAIKSIFTSKYARYAGSTAATMAITLVSVAIAANSINKGF